MIRSVGGTGSRWEHFDVDANKMAIGWHVDWSIWPEFDDSVQSLLRQLAEINDQKKVSRKRNLEIGWW